MLASTTEDWREGTSQTDAKRGGGPIKLFAPPTFLKKEFLKNKSLASPKEEMQYGRANAGHGQRRVAFHSALDHDAHCLIGSGQVTPPPLTALAEVLEGQTRLPPPHPIKAGPTSLKGKALSALTQLGSTSDTEHLPVRKRVTCMCE